MQPARGAKNDGVITHLLENCETTSRPLPHGVVDLHVDRWSLALPPEGEVNGFLRATRWARPIPGRR